MATTTFTDGITLTAAAWFNDIDAAVYEGTFPAGISAITVTGATTLTAFAAATTLLTIGGTGSTSVVAIPGTLEASGTTGALTLAGGAYIAKKLNIVGTINSSATGGFIANTGASTASKYANIFNTGATLQVGVEASVGSGIFTGSTAYAAVFANATTTPIELAINNALVMRIASGGAVTVPNLAGSGSRHVVVDANGVMSAP